MKMEKKDYINKNLYYCKIPKGGKNPDYKNWQNILHEWKDINLDIENYGVLTGYNNLIVIDVDDMSIFEDKEIAVLLHEDTYIVKTGSGRGVHLYYYVDGDVSNLKNGQYGKLDIKWVGGQVIGAGSKHRSGGLYEVLNPVKIKTIQASDIYKLISLVKKDVQKQPEELLKERINITEHAIIRESKYIPIILDNIETQEKIAKTKTGMKNNDLFPNIAAFVYWHPAYLDKALDFCDKCGYKEAEFQGWLDKARNVNDKQIAGFLEKNNLYKDVIKTLYLSKLNFRKLGDLQSESDTGNFLILNYLEVDKLSFLVADAGGGKSFLVAYEACCLASGMNFLGNKVKKTKVLIIDNENIDRGIKHRYNGIIKGMGLNEKECWNNINILRVSNIEEVDVIAGIKEYVKNEGIGYIIVDTLRSHHDMDENNAQDISSAVRPFKDMCLEFGCAVKILHHTNKTGKYSGSTAIKGAGDEMIVMNTTSVQTENDMEKILVLTTGQDNKERYGNFLDRLSIQIRIMNKPVEFEFGGEKLETKMIDYVVIDKKTFEEKEEDKEYIFKMKLKDNMEIGLEYTFKDIEEMIKDLKIKGTSLRRYLEKLEYEKFILTTPKTNGKQTLYYLNTKYRVELK